MKFLFRKSLPLALLFSVLFVASSLAADLPLTTWEGRTMGCTYTVKIVDARLSDQQIESLQAEVDQQLNEVNRQMSHYQPDSELSRFNRYPAGTPFKVSSDFARVMRISRDLHDRSGGAFEPTLGPVINLWGFGEMTDVRKVPSPDQLQAALKNTGIEHVTLTTNNELIKNIPGLGVNLSAIAKGFGVDQMASVLRRHALTNFYVSIAGEVFAQGHNPNGDKWHVGISAPVSNWRIGDPVAAVVNLSGQAISTSGDFQKFFFDEHGRRLCHIFDPHTGWPVQHNLGAVSIVADSSMMADGLATTVFVLGADKGLRFIESCTNAAALFIVRESEDKFRTIPSSRFEAMTGYKP
jgi:thiamine biosynthesis lipoprotein